MTNKTFKWDIEDIANVHFCFMCYPNPDFYIYTFAYVPSLLMLLGPQFPRLC